MLDCILKPLLVCGTNIQIQLIIRIKEAEFVDFEEDDPVEHYKITTENMSYDKQNTAWVRI